MQIKLTLLAFALCLALALCQPGNSGNNGNNGNSAYTDTQLWNHAIECTTGQAPVADDQLTQVAACTSDNQWATGRQCSVCDWNGQFPSDPLGGNGKNKVHLCHGTSKPSSVPIHVSSQSLFGHFINSDGNTCGHNQKPKDQEDGKRHMPEALAGLPSVSGMVFDCDCDQVLERTAPAPSGCRAGHICYGVDIEDGALTGDLTYELKVRVHNWCSAQPDALVFDFGAGTDVSFDAGSSTLPPGMSGCSASGSGRKVTVTCSDWGNWRAPVSANDNSAARHPLFVFSVGNVVGSKFLTFTAKKSSHGFNFDETLSTRPLSECSDSDVPPVGEDGSGNCGDHSASQEWVCVPVDENACADNTPHHQMALRPTLVAAGSDLDACSYRPQDGVSANNFWDTWEISCDCEVTVKECLDQCNNRGTCNLNDGSCTCTDSNFSGRCSDRTGFTTTFDNGVETSTRNCVDLGLSGGDTQEIVSGPEGTTTTSCDGRVCERTSTYLECTDNGAVTKTFHNEGGCEVVEHTPNGGSKTTTTTCETTDRRTVTTNDGSCAITNVITADSHVTTDDCNGEISTWTGSDCLNVDCATGNPDKLVTTESCTIAIHDKSTNEQMSGDCTTTTEGGVTTTQGSATSTDGSDVSYENTGTRSEWTKGTCVYVSDTDVESTACEGQDPVCTGSACDGESFCVVSTDSFDGSVSRDCPGDGYTDRRLTTDTLIRTYDNPQGDGLVEESWNDDCHEKTFADKTVTWTNCDGTDGTRNPDGTSVETVRETGETIYKRDGVPYDPNPPVEVPPPADEQLNVVAEPCSDLNYCYFSSGHGECNDLSTCDCGDAYQGDDCGTAIVPPVEYTCDQCFGQGMDWCEDAVGGSCSSSSSCGDSCSGFSRTESAAGSESGLGSPEAVAAAIGGGVLALLILAAVIFAVVSFFGSKKAVAYIRSMNSEAAVPLKENPLFVPKDNEGFNPLYE